MNILGIKTGAQNIVKEIKQYHKQWLQHRHKQNTKIATEIQTGRKKERGTTEEEMEGPTSF